jgi:glycosyltransferase involved in cell wall biosynthesis
MVPFIEGGGTFIVDWLEANLKKAGHKTEVLKLPFHTDYSQIPEQMLALEMLDVSDHGDRMIALRTPSYLLRHPHKVIWFMHHHRGAYDLWGTPFQDIPATPAGLKVRELIQANDQRTLSTAQSLFAISRRVGERLQTYNRLAAETLYPPLMDAETYRTGEYGDYVFFPSRITPGKRQRLAVEAMRYVKSQVKLVIAGVSDVTAEWEQLQQLVARYQLESKVSILHRWISNQEKLDLYAGALGVLFIPFDEDYGYVTLEAFHSAKGVVTCTDSGAPLEFVTPGETGLVSDPEPQALAEHLDRLYLDKAQAVRMGRAGAEKCRSLNITWEHTLARLLA